MASMKGESGYSSDVEQGSSISDSNRLSRHDSDVVVVDYGATTTPITATTTTSADFVAVDAADGVPPPLTAADATMNNSSNINLEQQQHQGSIRSSLSVAQQRVHDQDPPHIGVSRQYWRDIILGVNDGLVSTFLLVAGVAGGGLSSKDILLTAIAGAIAGAVSMCAGEYVATKSQNEVLEGELKLERWHIENYQDYELKELRSELLPIIGITSQNQTNLMDQLVEYYKNDTEALLKIMTALEFGVLDHEVRSPCKAGMVSCFLFTGGALPSVIPFIFLSPMKGLFVAAAATTLALLIVGAVKTYATRGNWVTAATENLIIAGFGGGFAYAVGTLFDNILHTEP